MIVLGLNAFHGDAAAALIVDGKLVAAVEEERFRRIKHWAGFPSQSIAYCLKEAGITLGDVDHIAINQDSSAHRWRKIAYVTRTRPNLGLIWQRLRNRGKRQAIDAYFEQSFPTEKFRGTYHAIEHHLCHLMSAFYVSPFRDAAIVSVDGFGDFSSAAWGVGHGNSIELNEHVFFPHSLGIFYQALTQYLGFPHYGDEYKVMGLAPYGQPSYTEKLRKLVRLKSSGGFELDLRYFRHHREEVPYQWNDGIPAVGDLFSADLADLLGPRRGSGEALEQRHLDIARSAQAVYEEAFFNLVTTLQKRSGLTDIALAGGCAANSVANGKIRRQTPFKRVYVQAAAGDAGGAIGAAYAVWQKAGGNRNFTMDHAYWGPQFSATDVQALIESKAAHLEQADCLVETFADSESLCRKAARAVADGKVVGWFQGRMEWGPRALGNRSIVCDPRRADMKEILNAKIKRRESFRPFAPSVLDSAVGDWFEEDDDVPFMMQVFQIREDRRSSIPAVVHVDGSGRLQTVKKQTNPRYYGLIEEFLALTGVPMVLNTSFNENEPVVCTPAEALDCFLRTKMDVLVIENVMLMRHEKGESTAALA